MRSELRDEFAAQWSLDGRIIAFVSNKDGAEGQTSQHFLNVVEHLGMRSSHSTCEACLSTTILQ